MAAQYTITHMLRAHRRGDAEATDALFALIYQELKSIAHRQLARRRPGQTVNTTALVHEAYLKLADRARDTWKDKTHFLAVVATAMRHILVDYARKQRAAKRGGQAHRTSLDASVLFKEGTTVEMLDLDKALTQLSETDPRLSQVVELRVFGGLSEEETAEVLGLSARTVRRYWFKAKSYLYLALKEEGKNDHA